MNKVKKNLTNFKILEYLLCSEIFRKIHRSQVIYILISTHPHSTIKIEALSIFFMKNTIGLTLNNWLKVS